MLRNILAEVLRLLDTRVPFALATVVTSQGSVPAKPGARMIVHVDGSIAGTVGGAGLEQQVIDRALECMRTGKGGVYPFTLWYKSPGGLDSLCGGTVDVHIEYLKPRPHILICGGGHVGKALADMSVPVEYYHSIYDVRSEYASLSRFPHAREHHHGDVASFARSLDPRAYSHLVVCGHSYHVDLEILEKMLPVFGGWVGVIASAAKKREMFRALEERGLAAAQLARVECPIGLSIGATTPAEIAVSILGSIIREQNTDAREPRNPA